MCGARTRAPEQDVVGNVTYGKHLSTDEILRWFLLGCARHLRSLRSDRRYVTLADTPHRRPWGLAGAQIGSVDR